MAVAKRETLKRFKDLLLEHCDVVAYTIYGHTIVQASFFINKIDRKEKKYGKRYK